MLVDSHCHLNLLDLTPFANGLEGVMQQASAAGITHMLCVSVEEATIPAILHISETYQNVSASIGVHPTDSRDADISVNKLVNLAPEILLVKGNYSITCNRIAQLYT